MFTAAIENLPPPNRIFTRDPGCFMASHQDVLSAEANSILFSSTYTSPTPSVICCWIAGTGSQRLVSRPPLTSCIYKLLSEIVRTKQSADNVSGVVSGSLSGKTCRGVEVIVSWSHGGASSTEVLIDVPFRKDVSGEESAMTSESDSSSQSALPIAGRENIGDVTPGKGLSGLIWRSPINREVGREADGNGEGNDGDNGGKVRLTHKSRGNGPAFRFYGLKGMRFGDSAAHFIPRPPDCKELPPTISFINHHFLKYHIIKQQNITFCTV